MNSIDLLFPFGFYVHKITELFSTLFCEPFCSFLMDESSSCKRWGACSENLHLWKCCLPPSYCIMAVYSISWIDYLIFSMTTFWNMIIWVGAGLFSFIALMGTLSLEDFFLGILENFLIPCLSLHLSSIFFYVLFLKILFACWTC